MINCDRVFFSYLNRLVIDNVDLSVANGEAVGLLGPNGSGKSLLMRLILGQEAADSGEIKILMRVERVPEGRGAFLIGSVIGEPVIIHHIGEKFLGRL